MLAPLAFVFKFMYQKWHTITLEQLETSYYDPTGLSNGKLSPAQFEDIVGYAYPTSSTDTPTTESPTTVTPTTEIPTTETPTTETPTTEAPTEEPTTVETAETPTTVAPEK